MTKIIGVGMHKTGTTTLGDALRMLGFARTGWQPETASLYKRGHKAALLDMMEDFDVFEDAPWFLMYKDACDRYPDCRLILTHRRDMEAWFASLTKHIDRIAPDAYSFRSVIYGTDDLLSIKQHVLDTHARHVEDVKAFATERDIPLLEICWENGDGWKEICEFVGKPVPDQPFPHANAAPGQGPKTSFARRLKRAVSTRLPG